MNEKEVFSHDDLSWYEVKCTRSCKIDLIATIHLCRLEDFKKGIQNNTKS